MTDTISDEARELAKKIAEPYGFYDCDFYNAMVNGERLAQSALTAARADERNKALEDAAKVCDRNFANGAYADATRAMKVQP